MTKYIVLTENRDIQARCETIEQVGDVIEEMMDEYSMYVEDFDVFEVSRKVKLVRKVEYVEAED